MPLEGLSQKLFGRSQIAPFAEPELNSVAMAVDGTVEIAPLAPYFDICLVDMPLSGDGSLSLIEPLQQTVCSLPVEVARPKLCDERGLRWMGRRRASRTGDEPCSRIAKCLSVWIPPS